MELRDFWGKSSKSWLFLILLFIASFGFYSNVFNWIPRWRQREVSQSCEAHDLQGKRESPPLSKGDCCPDTCRVPRVPRMLYPKAHVLQPTRVDVLLMTPWFAPIIWDGTYDSAILDAQFRNTTIGLTVFAIKNLGCRFFPFSTLNMTYHSLLACNVSAEKSAGRRMELPLYVVFLKLFLETAEKYFMVGHRVIYYILTDRPADVPQIPLQEGRRVVILKVRNYTRWQDVSLHRMEMISNFSQQRFLHEVDYLVCVDVDMKFSDHVGVEILSSLFGTLHPGFYASDRQRFTYERRPLSQAYIPEDEGDFYYAGGFFGGSVAEVYRLTTACHQAMVVDKANGIEAVWHDESHLNKYLLYHKPTKVLSPEYVWDERMLRKPPYLRRLRYVAVPKNHAQIRSR
ncbi:histo-blood group ABO system transferase 2-like isoform X2 [Equus asinus]|uniref:histo-blood group ABO system transferase 2-like isoform X2 n=1 Tax=Equus asinus TaxID=9793 RepID=UPI0038F5F189